ncbi:MAG: sugar phosphate nucleotidyltransferase [Candidatus Aminicenantes bacterium]|nr:sugar phosphate nucleotidyltransferase [Candidatus Aminicenantes bacterium]
MKASAPDLKAVIMAGGSGTRFWPLSRRRSPKQFLPIAGETAMIRETLDRVLPLIPARDVYTVAGAGHTATIRRLLPELPAANLLVEPAARNTAPSLILATAAVYLRNPEAVVAVLASDHLIRDRKTFLRKLKAAAKTAAAKDCLVTFGIPPTFPSTGYGYIRYEKDAGFVAAGEVFYPAAEFKEKPRLEQARAFLEAGNYLWNSGMFLWRASVFAERLEAFAPDFHPYWVRILDALRAKSASRLKAVFREIPALSIDYALMERARGVVVLRGDFGWSDVGAWSSLFDVWEKDADGNAAVGDVLQLDSSGTLCRNPGRFTALIGVRDLIVVDTPDALLVCARDQDQRVKEVLDFLARSGRVKQI